MLVSNSLCRLTLHLPSHPNDRCWVWGRDSFLHRCRFIALLCNILKSSTAIKPWKQTTPPTWGWWRLGARVQGGTAGQQGRTQGDVVLIDRTTRQLQINWLFLILSNWSGETIIALSHLLSLAIKCNENCNYTIQSVRAMGLSKQCLEIQQVRSPK